MKSYHSLSTDQTKDIAAQLATQLMTKSPSQAQIIALTGGLGAGKTTFTQGFALGLGVKEKVLSPTFVFHRIHSVPDSKLILHHIDLYRLDQVNNLEELGLAELFSDPNNIILIEWSEKLGRFLPQDAIKVEIKATSGNQRIITLSPGVV